MSALILIVDDDAGIREVFGTCLELEGYETLAATNGRTALDLLQSGAKPSLILLDWMMPVLNGQEFLELQRLDPVLSLIPVVVISAFATLDGKKLGVPHLQKPVKLETLLDAIASYRNAS